jgi:hypothetical protein
MTGQRRDSYLAGIRRAATVEAVDRLLKDAYGDLGKNELTDAEIPEIEQAGIGRRAELGRRKPGPGTGPRSTSAGLMRSGIAFHLLCDAPPRSRRGFYDWRTHWREDFERDSRLSKTALVLLSAICESLNASPNNQRYGWAWTSISTISRKTGRTKTSILAAIRQAEALGHLRVVRGGGRGRPNLYAPSFRLRTDEGLIGKGGD